MHDPFVSMFVVVLFMCIFDYWLLYIKSLQPYCVMCYVILEMCLTSELWYMYRKRSIRLVSLNCYFDSDMFNLCWDNLIISVWLITDKDKINLSGRSHSANELLDTLDLQDNPSPVSRRSTASSGNFSLLSSSHIKLFAFNYRFYFYLKIGDSVKYKWIIYTTCVIFVLIYLVESIVYNKTHQSVPKVISATQIYFQLSLVQ